MEILLLLAIVAVVMFFLLRGGVSSTRRTPRALAEREDTTPAWEAAFISDVVRSDILMILADDYGFTEEALTKVRPSDTLAGLYEMKYEGVRASHDEMEGVDFLVAVENACEKQFNDADDLYSWPLSDFAALLNLA